MKKDLMARIKAKLNESVADADVKVSITGIESDSMESFTETVEELGYKIEKVDESDDVTIVLPESKLSDLTDALKEFGDIKVNEASCDDDEGKDDDDEDEDKDKKKDKKKGFPDVKESFKKILDGVDLPENVVTDIQTLFVAAVEDRATTISTSKIDEMEEAFQTEISEINENVGKYLNYVAKEWMTENEVQVECGLKVEFAESLIEGVKTVFDENYVDIPEDRVDLVSEMEEINSGLKTELDEAMIKIITMNYSINEAKSKTIVDEVTSDMTDTQKEKFSELVENSVEFIDEDDYKSKVELLLKKYFTEDTDETEGDDTDDSQLTEAQKRRKRYAL